MIFAVGNSSWALSATIFIGYCLSLGSQVVCSSMDYNILWVKKSGGAEQFDSRFCGGAPKCCYSVGGEQF